jgi:hypothetical protein
MNARAHYARVCWAKQEKCSIDSAEADLEPLQVKRKPRSSQPDLKIARESSRQGSCSWPSSNWTSRGCGGHGRIDHGGIRRRRSGLVSRPR